MKTPIPAPTLTEIKAWPATVDVAVAASAFGLSKSFSYEAIARGEFPAKTLKVGGRWRVITASIVKALSVDDP